jgi:hypothetical protein
MVRNVLLLKLLLVGCSEASTPNTTKNYYDLSGLMNQQIAYLSDKQLLTQKTLKVTGQKTESLETKDIYWKQELELFLQADINKQAYNLSYDKQELPDGVIYKLKKGEDLPVQVLKIVFDEEKNPKHIEASMHTKNYLYESQKNLSMDLTKKRLKSYQIEGWQELFIGQRKSFSVEGIMK